jgi:hypothetical protein
MSRCKKGLGEASGSHRGQQSLDPQERAWSQSDRDGSRCGGRGQSTERVRKMSSGDQSPGIGAVSKS